MASTAILLLPFVSLVYVNSRSSLLDLVLLIGYLVFAAFSIIAFLYEKAEEESGEEQK